MRIQGVDPIILNRIQEKLSKQTIQQTKQSQIGDKQHRHRDQGRESAENENLEAVVKKLNSTAENLGIALSFMLDEDTPGVVLVVERETQKIIREVPPEQVHEMLADMKCFVGLMVDYLL